MYGVGAFFILTTTFNGILDFYCFDAQKHLFSLLFKLSGQVISLEKGGHSRALVRYYI